MKRMRIAQLLAAFCVACLLAAAFGMCACAEPKADDTHFVGGMETPGSYDAMLEQMAGRTPEELINATRGHAYGLATSSTRDGRLLDADVQKFMKFVDQVCDYLCNEYWDDATVYGILQEDSLISVREGESGIGYGPNYAAIHTVLNGKLSKAYDTYLRHMTEYLSRYLIDDMALMLSWDQLAQLLVDWSVFLKDYPDFIAVDSVNSNLRYGLYLYAGCFNLDNTPVIAYDAALEIEMLEESVKASYEKFLSNPANEVCVYYADIEALYKTWERNNFEYTQEVKDFIDGLDAKLHDPAEIRG